MYLYKKLKHLHEVLPLLAATNGKGRVIAGGTDLVLKLRRKELDIEVLVDISEIVELRQIREADGWIYIGAAATHAEIAKNGIVLREARALAQGCGQVGSPQIRNMGTLVGNVVSAQPAADGAIALMALEADLKIESLDGTRWVALEDTYRGVGLSAVDAAREIVTEVRLKKTGQYSNTGFFRMARRKALALPTLNGAVSLTLDSSRRFIQKARIAIGPVAEKPFRSRGAEAQLQSSEFSHGSLLEACRIAAKEANPRTSLRGSAEYRKEMVKVNLFRTIESVLDQIGRTE